MTKRFSILYFLLLYSLSAYSQIQPEPPGKTYALVVGIANYEDRNIPNLNYSNRDARVFADYLMSPAGGSIPKENIRLLIDTIATTAAVYNSLEWLKKKTEEDLEEDPNSINTIYFYFSGHGDLESQTLKQLGFLLTYNTPPNNFLNNAIRLEDLNYYANTLSVRLKAKVILITDACHSGKLAGSDKGGSTLVGRELSTARAKEIRIASCAPDELSQEDAAWDGGRGVFSYYLVNGLKGFADKNNDSTVTLNEIRNYLNISLANDQDLQRIITAQLPVKTQTPVLKGPDDFKLARVNNAAFLALQHSVMQEPVLQSAQEYFFKQLGNRDLLESVDFGSLAGLPKEKLVDGLIDMIIDLQDSAITKNQLDRFQDISNNGNVWDEIKGLDNKKDLRSFISRMRLLIDSNRLNPERYTDVLGSQPDSAKKFVEDLDNSLWANREFFEKFKATLHSDPEKMQSFIESLVELLHNSGQKIINLYLEGDLAELERRSYYYSRNGYDVYINMYKLALQLVPPDLPLARILKVNLNYFSGVVARLKLPTTAIPDQSKLIQKALEFQNRALALEPDAAFVHNELGILLWAQKNFTRAKEHFLKATELASTWALPWANLSGLYAQTKEFDKGIAAGKTADSLKAGLHTSAIQQGYLYEQKGNLLFAEEYYRKAIDINSRHYFPFERLGFVYMNTTHYALADSFFYEADLRKKGYHFRSNDFILALVAAPNQVTDPPPCMLDTTQIRKDDIIGLFNWGMQAFRAGNIRFAEAERVFRRLIAADNSNPLVFHYLGKLYYRLGNWEASELMFQFAMKNHLDEAAFDRYSDSINAKARFLYDRATRNCFEVYFQKHYYQANEDYYFLASVYENWQHYDDAEMIYRQIISQEPESAAGYVKLWRQMEEQGRYTEAEKLVREFDSRNKYAGPPEVNAFYQRMMERYPDDGLWPHKLGLYLYDTAFTSTYQYLDTIIFFPLMNKEVYMGLNEYNRLFDDPLMRQDVNENIKLLEPSELQNLNQANLRIELPGTGEVMILANGPIYAPRKEAIYYLSLADSLLTEEGVKADINNKLGNLFVRAGSNKLASPYYERSVRLAPGNSNARMKLADVYRTIYKNSSALDQLNYLYDSNQINFTQRMLLAEFSVHEGKFQKAQKLLTDAQRIYPYPVPATFDLLGRLNMLSNRWKQAIPYYQTYLRSNPSDPTIYYNIARSHQLSGNKSQALAMLKEAKKKGFNYSWVLQNDEAWKNLRNTTEWKKIFSAVN